MGVFQALAVLAGHYLDVDDTEHCEDEDSFLLDWSSLTESVPLLPDPLPPFTLGTHVRKGEWSKQSSTPASDGEEEDLTSPSDKHIKVTPTSPGSDGGEVIPPSPVISSMARKGRRKHQLGRSSKKTVSQLSISPLLTQTGMTGQVSCVMCSIRVATDSYLAGQLAGQSSSASRARQSSQQDSS